jgi:hypothetical protein
MGLSRAGSLGGCSSFMKMGQFVVMHNGSADALGSAYTLYQICL